MFVYGFPGWKKNSGEEHKVVLEFSDEFDAGKYVLEIIQPWMDENLNDDCWCEVTWRNKQLPIERNSPIMVCTAIGINITLYFSDLSDAALFRLRF